MRIRCSAGKLQLKREDSELMESSDACSSSPGFVQQPQTESLWVVALRWGAPRAFQQPAAVESMVATTPAPSWQEALYSALLAFLPAAPHSAAVNTSAARAAASRGTAASSPPAENRDAAAACRTNSGDPDPPTTTAAVFVCGPQAQSLMRLPLAAVVTVASPSVTQPPPTDAEATVTDPAAALQLISTPEPPSPVGRSLQLPDDATAATAPRSGEEAAIVTDEGAGGSAARCLRSSPVVQPAALPGGGGLDEAALLSFIEKDAAEGEWLTVCKLAASADCRRTVAGVATEMTACGLLWHDLLMITATTAGSGSSWHNRT